MLIGVLLTRQSFLLQGIDGGGVGNGQEVGDKDSVGDSPDGGLSF